MTDEQLDPDDPDFLEKAERWVALSRRSRKRRVVLARRPAEAANE